MQNRVMHITTSTLCIAIQWGWFNLLIFGLVQVRVYTTKRVFQELEAAKEEYIRATFGVSKNHKILLPKIVESFVKDSGLCPARVIEITQLSLP